MCLSGTTIRSGGIATTNERLDQIALLGIYVRLLQQELYQKLTQRAGFSYTSFTGCAILIFGASQKLLPLSGKEASYELMYTASHLSALSFCSYNNTIATRLHSQLQIILNDIREVIVSPVYGAMCEMGIVVKDRALLPFSHYDAVEGAEEISRTILGITRSSMGILQGPQFSEGNEDVNLA